MSTRYFTNAFVALLGGLVVVGSQAFASTALAWLAFGIAIAVLGLSVLVQFDSQRGVAQRGLA